MIAEWSHILLNTHVIENQALRDYVVSGLEYVKEKGLLYLDENVLLGSSMNSSVIIETYLHSDELMICRRVVNELQLWNFTSVYDEYMEVAREVLSVFGPESMGAQGSSSNIASHLPKAGRAVNQAINLTAIGLFWLFDFINRTFDVLFQIVLFYLTLYGCLGGMLL